MLESPLEIVPHVGVPPLRLGMTRDEVEALLGPPRPGPWMPDPTAYRVSNYYGVHGGLMLNFDEGGCLVFIEVSWDDVTRPTVLYGGSSVFDTPADELVDRMRRDAAPLVTEHGTSVLFAELDLTLWRPGVPSEYAADEPEDEYRSGRYWMAIGIGCRGHLREVINGAADRDR